MPLYGWDVAGQPADVAATGLNVYVLLSMARWAQSIKASHTQHRALGPELIPVYRQSAHGGRLPFLSASDLSKSRAPPPLGRNQVILLSDRGTWVWTTCPRLLITTLGKLFTPMCLCHTKQKLSRPAFQAANDRRWDNYCRTALFVQRRASCWLLSVVCAWRFGVH